MRNETEWRKCCRKICIDVSPKNKVNSSFFKWLLEREHIHNYNEETKKYKIMFDSKHYHYCYAVARQIKKGDNVTVVSGKEGIGGKSVFAINSCALITPSIKLENICFTPQDFFRIINGGKLPPESSIIMDEGMLFLDSKKSLSRESIAVLQAISILRVLRYNIWICIPNFFKIDSTIREHRANDLFIKDNVGKYARYRGNVELGGVQCKGHGLQRINANKDKVKISHHMVRQFCSPIIDYYDGDAYKWQGRNREEDALITINDISQESYEEHKLKNTMLNISRLEDSLKTSIGSDEDSIDVNDNDVDLNTISDDLNINHVDLKSTEIEDL